MQNTVDLMNAVNGKEFVRSVKRNKRNAFTREEASEALGKRGPALTMALQRLKEGGWAVPFSREFYVIPKQPGESSEIPNPLCFVHEWARFLGADYYIGGLSAASLYDAAPPQPGTVQIFMNKVVRTVETGGLRFDVFYRKEIPGELIERRESPFGCLFISGCELTMYDLLAYRGCCPSLPQAAEAIGCLAGGFKTFRMIKWVRRGGRLAVLQRLGWIMDHLGRTERAGGLYLFVGNRRLNWRRLDVRRPPHGPRDERWKIIVNCPSLLAASEAARSQKKKTHCS